jgi:hypothetical protein
VGTWRGRPGLGVLAREVCVRAAALPCASTGRGTIDAQLLAANLELFEVTDRTRLEKLNGKYVRSRLGSTCR